MPRHFFTVIKTSRRTRARRTELRTAHGKISGPFFMPIATRGAVRGTDVNELTGLSAQIILANTYHLLLRPGPALLKKFGGLHAFMNWPGPILTDSGGYQVFSLSQHRTITPAGVHFADPQNGQKYFLSPGKALQIQHAIGSDIQMVLDECPPYPVSYEYARRSLELTLDWAGRSRQEFVKIQKKSIQKNLLFGIVQGSVYKKLRQTAAIETVKIGFDGYAIGGVAVGEPRKKLKQVLEWVTPLLPADRPRYLMGVGKPEELVYAVTRGIDMFDCVIPTREARHGRLYRWKDSVDFDAWLKTGRFTPHFYETIDIAKARHKSDRRPLNHGQGKDYSLAYIHHLFRSHEILGIRLATLNNLSFYLTLMEKIRRAIVQNIL